MTLSSHVSGGRINSAVAGEMVSIDTTIGGWVPSDVVTGEVETGEIVANEVVSGDSLTRLLGDSTSS